MTIWMNSANQFKSKRIADKSEGCCYYCGTPLTKLSATYDHVIPRAQNGLSQIDNLVLACEPCNISKADLSIEDYRRKLNGTQFFGERLQEAGIGVN